MIKIFNLIKNDDSLSQLQKEFLQNFFSLKSKNIEDYQALKECLPIFFGTDSTAGDVLDMINLIDTIRGNDV